MAIPYARLLATVVFALLYLFLAALLLAPFAGPASITISGTVLPLRDAFPFIFVTVATIGAVVASLHWVLYSQPFDDHLGEN